MYERGGPGYLRSYGDLYMQYGALAAGTDPDNVRRPVGSEDCV